MKTLSSGKEKIRTHIRVNTLSLNRSLLLLPNTHTHTSTLFTKGKPDTQFCWLLWQWKKKKIYIKNLLSNFIPYNFRGKTVWGTTALLLSLWLRMVTYVFPSSETGGMCACAYNVTIFPRIFHNLIKFSLNEFYFYTLPYSVVH